jgi:hypothetical protein
LARSASTSRRCVGSSHPSAFPGIRLAGPADTLLWGHGAHVTRIEGCQTAAFAEQGFVAHNFVGHLSRNSSRLRCPEPGGRRTIVRTMV